MEENNLFNILYTVSYNVKYDISGSITAQIPVRYYKIFAKHADHCRVKIFHIFTSLQ